VQEGGFQVVFFLYSCLTYSELVVGLLELTKYLVLIEYAIFKMVLLTFFKMVLVLLTFLGIFRDAKQ
jgi:hypothetical protein